MPSHIQLSQRLSLAAIEEWAADAQQALLALEKRLRSINRHRGPPTPTRWLHESEAELRDRIQRDLEETERCAAFTMLACLESQLRERLVVELENSSVAAPAVPVDEMTFEDLCDWWRLAPNVRSGQSLSKVKGWIGFRNWMAHGRGWDVNLPTSVASLHLVAKACRDALGALPSRP